MPEKKKNHDIAVDLFCGAGGASCGIETAGFELVAGVDHNTDALDTHADNCGGYTVTHDLSEVDPSVLPERAHSPDYLHGSPPCKGFSNANDNRSIDDPRNSLVFDFIEWVETLQPAVVTMENVTGMVTITDHFMDKVEAAFRDAGYAVKWRVLNAADYGVPQTRRRVITVGIRQDLDVPSRWFPKPTHAETATTTLDGRQLDEWVTVQKAIGDLAGEVREHRPQGDNNATTHAVWRVGDTPAHTVKGQGSHTLRADGGLVQNHTPQDHGEQARERFRAILRGDKDANGLSGRVADLGSPSPTITADEGAAVPPIRPPNHEPRAATDAEPMPWEHEEPSETITDARLPDKKRAPGAKSSQFDGARRLTVRECARLQSFPDWFVFSGTKTAQYAQVGNAVPPRLQYHISKNLRQKVLCEDAYPPKNQ